MLNLKEGDYVLLTEKADKPKLTFAKIEFIDDDNLGCVDVKDMHLPKLRRVRACSQSLIRSTRSSTTTILRSSIVR